MNLRQKRLMYNVEGVVGLIGGIVTSYSGMDNIGEFVLYGSLIGVTSYFSRKSVLIKNESCNTIELKEAKLCYDKIINNICDVLKEYNLVEPMDIFVAFCLLYRGGYLSYDKTFEKTSNNVKDYDGFLPLNIINGNGVCRHLAPFLVDIYIGMGYKARKLYLYISDELKDKKNPNHVVTMLEDKGYLYILDPTLIDIIYKEDDKLLYVMQDYKISYEVRQLNIINKAKVDIKNMLELSCKSKDELNNLVNNALDLFTGDIIECFSSIYDKNKDLYEYIHSVLNMNYLDYNVDKKYVKR